MRLTLSCKSQACYCPATSPPWRLLGKIWSSMKKSVTALQSLAVPVHA